MRVLLLGMLWGASGCTYRAECYQPCRSQVFQITSDDHVICCPDQRVETQIGAVLCLCAGK